MFLMKPMVGGRSCYFLPTFQKQQKELKVAFVWRRIAMDALQFVYLT